MDILDLLRIFRALQYFSSQDKTKETGKRFQSTIIWIHIY